MAIGSVRYDGGNAFPWGPPGQQERQDQNMLGQLLLNAYQSGQKAYEGQQKQQMLQQVMGATDRQGAIDTISQPRGSKFGNMIFGTGGTAGIEQAAGGNILGQLLEDPVDRQLKEARAKYYSTPKTTTDPYEGFTPEERAKARRVKAGLAPRAGKKTEQESKPTESLEDRAELDKILKKVEAVSNLPRSKQGRFDDWYAQDAYERLRDNFRSAVMEVDKFATIEEIDEALNKRWSDRTGGMFFQEYMPIKDMDFSDNKQPQQQEAATGFAKTLEDLKNDPSLVNSIVIDDLTPEQIKQLERVLGK